MAISEKAQKIIDLVKELSVIELNELVKALEEEFGVSAAPVMVAGGAAAGWEEAGGAKDSFDVELTEIGDQKISVIKVVKAELGLGLKDAKELVEKAPVVVKEGVKPEEAEALKTKLEEVGAKVTLK